MCSVGLGLVAVARSRLTSSKRRRGTGSSASAQDKSSPLTPSWLETQGTDLRLAVVVAPRASRTRIMGVHDGRLKIQLAAPPVDGRANDVLVRFLADCLEVARAQVEIIGGASSRRKTVRLANISSHHALVRLSPPSSN